MNYSKNNLKIEKNNAYIGNIQVSKGMLLARLKKAQGEAQDKKQMAKTLPKKV